MQPLIKSAFSFRRRQLLPDLEGQARVEEAANVKKCNRDIRSFDNSKLASFSDVRNEGQCRRGLDGAIESNDFDYYAHGLHLKKIV